MFWSALTSWMALGAWLAALPFLAAEAPRSGWLRPFPVTVSELACDPRPAAVTLGIVTAATASLAVGRSAVLQGLSATYLCCWSALLYFDWCSAPREHAVAFSAVLLSAVVLLRRLGHEAPETRRVVRWTVRATLALLGLCVLWGAETWLLGLGRTWIPYVLEASSLLAGFSAAWTTRGRGTAASISSPDKQA